MATLEGVNRTTSQYGDLRGAVLDRTPSQFCCLERAADHSIMAPRRSRSAHLRRPWRAKYVLELTMPKHLELTMPKHLVFTLSGAAPPSAPLPLCWGHWIKRSGKRAATPKLSG
jgi:hypothetical protein